MAELAAGVVVLASLIVAVVGFDLAALKWGFDSRERMGDDHARLP